MSLVIPVSQSQLVHTAAAVMTGIHDVFPANDADNGDDPISEKKLKKLEGQYSTVKTLLGFDFDGKSKTMWLEAAKREKLLTILRGWIRTGHKGTAGIPFKEFESTIAKIRHAFTCIPMGASLLSPCNRVLKVKPAYVYLNRNKRVLTAVEGCRTLLRESTKEPTRCRQLVTGWPDYIGFVDASSHGAGGVVIGELSPCIPAIFRWQWPLDVAKDIKTANNPGGHITNSDLEMAGFSSYGSPWRKFVDLSRKNGSPCSTTTHRLLGGQQNLHRSARWWRNTSSRRWPYEHSNTRPAHLRQCTSQENAWR